MADYNGTEDGKVAGHGPFWAAARAVGDGIFSCPARRTARAFAAAGPSQGPWLYFFNHTLAALQVLLGTGADLL